MSWTRNLSLTLLAVAACGDDAAPADSTTTGPVLQRASRSSTIALSDDGAHVAMVNPEDGTLAIFETTNNGPTGKVATGGSPASVVIGPDSKTAFVSNRADGTVVRITGIDGGTPAIDATAQVGSEPTGLALSPTGKKLFVAEYAESRVSVIDTATMTVSTTIAVDRPRALMVTNNLDPSDDDETLIVAQYFGTPVPGHESLDDGRAGHVRLVALSDLTTSRDLALAAIDSGFPKGGTGATVHASPNQLGALAVANGRVYITAIEASPEGPTRFDNNLFPVVHVGDLASGAEVLDATGTTNLARKVYDAIPTPSATAPRFVPGELSDIDFVPGSNVAYVVGRAGDVMLRVTFGDTSVDIGSTQNKEIDLAGNAATIGQCQGPTGLVVDGPAQRAYVNCWVTRRLGVVDLAAQQMTATVQAAPLPTDAAELSAQRGRRFYFTGRGRWSANVGNGAKGGEGWSSCGSCHPDGLTDNITWSFGTGPRQTTSQDGTFSHGPGAQKQRILNWTAVNDEHHDFENNTRGVSGGLGAITTAANLADCGQLDKETPQDLKPGGVAIGGLQRPLKELADDPAGCQHHDWDDVEAYVKTIAPVHARRTADAAQVARGRQLFVDGACAKCHGGSGWTISRRFYAPSGSTNNLLANTQFAKPSFFPSTWMYDNSGANRMHVSGQPVVPADATGPAEPSAIGVGQAACLLRNVGSFGNGAATDALEIRLVNGAASRAEGRAGYNVPSLYGLSLGAPYLHHGQAPSLEALFMDATWANHTNAANANFSVTLATAGKIDDLVAFLTSIDASTPEIAVPTDPTSGLSFDACPVTFP